MSNFWRTWLNAWCYVIILSGLAISGAGFEGLETFTKTWICYLNLEAAPEFNQIERFSFGLLGAVTTGWGLMLLYIIEAAHNNNEGNRIWRRLAFTLFIWYAIDGYISYRNGFTLNIVANSVILIAFLFPLYISGKLEH